MRKEENNISFSNVPVENIRTIQLISEWTSTPEKIFATFDLSKLLVMATRINEQYAEDFDATFSSILLSFLVADDSISKWFKGYIKEANIDLTPVLIKRKIDWAKLDKIAGNPISAQELEQPKRQTISAKSLLEEAQEFRKESASNDSNVPLDVRHLMAAYIYSPRAHTKELESLAFQKADWSNAFLGLIALEYHDELEYWKKKHHDTFRTPPVVIVEGLSPHIATDCWTCDDSLGYWVYARAIYGFIKHKQTKPPISISIQAPWGGGKTSLMRMIQELLDPQAIKEVEEAAKQPRGCITIQNVLDEVKKWTQKNRRQELLQIRTAQDKSQEPSQQDTREQLPQVPQDKNIQCITIWFNAWKYESTNQVWAGLVDAIMQQISARLNLEKRERFWLRLNLKRVDADKIRQKIYDRIFRFWWQEIRPWLIGLSGACSVSLAIALVGGITKQNTAQNLGWIGTGAAALTSAIVSIQKCNQVKKDVEKEPASVSLGEYLDIPNYSKELGFIHQVEADLRRVLDSVPRKYQPIVIFIDDLDRCSPTKIAQVVEAVNLFLAGDFKNCIFVLGMDTEMVAAALQAAHKDILAYLSEDAGIPIGWRFMDKFIQLPFIIPPAGKDDLNRYRKTLFEDFSELSRPIDPAPPIKPVDSNPPVTKLTDRKQFEDKLNQLLELFTDKNPEIQKLISDATSYFQGNPRELKRFFNAFRFQYCLWSARRIRHLENPTLEQLLRWTVLSMKWPEVVRWIRRGGENEWGISTADSMSDTGVAVASRLKWLEDISTRAPNLREWQQQMQEVLSLMPKKVNWLKDDELYQFFHEQGTKYREGEQLSDGVGKGLW